MSDIVKLLDKEKSLFTKLSGKNRKNNPGLHHLEIKVIVTDRCTKGYVVMLLDEYI